MIKVGATVGMMKKNTILDRGIVKALYASFDGGTDLKRFATVQFKSERVNILLNRFGQIDPMRYRRGIWYKDLLRNG